MMRSSVDATTRSRSRFRPAGGVPPPRSRPGRLASSSPAPSAWRRRLPRPARRPARQRPLARPPTWTLAGYAAAVEDFANELGLRGLDAARPLVRRLRRRCSTSSTTRTATRYVASCTDAERGAGRPARRRTRSRTTCRRQRRRRLRARGDGQHAARSAARSGATSSRSSPTTRRPSSRCSTASSSSPRPTTRTSWGELHALDALARSTGRCWRSPPSDDRAQPPGDARRIARRAPRRRAADHRRRRALPVRRDAGPLLAAADRLAQPHGFAEHVVELVALVDEAQRVGRRR